MNRFVRLRGLIGEQAFLRLQNAKVAVFGLGGVGGYVVEGLARSGVGAFLLVDYDTVSQSNINRQIFALDSTVGQLKTDVAKARISDINPNALVTLCPIKLTRENINNFDFSDIDYIVDAIDYIDGKVALVLRSRELGIPLICCSGTGNKQSTSFAVRDLFSLTNDKLARAFRHKLRAVGITSLPVVCSTEPNVCSGCIDEHGHNNPATIVYTPAVAAMVIVQEVISKLI